VKNSRRPGPQATALATAKRLAHAARSLRRPGALPGHDTSHTRSNIIVMSQRYLDTAKTAARAPPD
jgi:hypothetical protein